MEKQIKIFSEIERISEVENFLKEILMDEKISRKCFCKIYISVIEAVNNAIRHGNCLKKEKIVSIIYKRSDFNYEFIIEDEGIGFNFDVIDDPTLKENLKKESGRGIFLMKRYSNDLIFENKGSKVKLLFLI